MELYKNICASKLKKDKIIGCTFRVYKRQLILELSMQNHDNIFIHNSDRFYKNIDIITSSAKVFLKSNPVHKYILHNNKGKEFQASRVIYKYRPDVDHVSICTYIQLFTYPKIYINRSGFVDISICTSD